MLNRLNCHWAAMEKAETPTEAERVLAADGPGSDGPELEDGEPYLKPVKAGKPNGGKRVELDEEASPTAGRRFSRT